MVAVYDQAATCAYNEPFRCGLRLNPGKRFLFIFFSFFLLALHTDLFQILL